MRMSQYSTVTTCLLTILIPIVVSAAETPDASLTAAIAHTSLPNEHPTLVDRLEETVRQQGYHTVRLDANALCDAEQLSAGKVDLLVLPNAADMPADSIAVIEGYLRNGGDIIALNTPVWQRLYIKADGRWIDQAQYQQTHANEQPPHLVVTYTDQTMAQWQQFPDAVSPKADIETVTGVPFEDQAALHVTTPGFKSWINFGPAPLDNPFPPSHSLTVFSAKGTERTNQLCIEWEEKDGSRWIAMVGLSPHWRQYVLRPEDFHYWHSKVTREQTTFNPQNARVLKMGFAGTHTPSLIDQPLEFWIGPIGTAPADGELGKIAIKPTIPALDTLSPGYKFYECREVSNVQPYQVQRGIEKHPAPLPDMIRSPHPRPTDIGYNRGRDWCWRPLLLATGEQGQWRGTPATLLIHADGPYKGGVWASFAIDDPEWFLQAPHLNEIARVADRIKRDIFVIDAGSDYFRYFDDQDIRLGLRAISFNHNPEIRVEFNISNAHNSSQRQAYTGWLQLKPGAVCNIEFDHPIDQWPEEGFNMRVEAFDGETVIYRQGRRLEAWRPHAKKNYITVEDGHFLHKGQPWRPHGINYMPSSGIGIEDGEVFEFWMSRQAYDPDIVQRDLSHIKELGFNAISIFVYAWTIQDQNLLDILCRAERLGLKVNLSLRPGTPMDFPWHLVRQMIESHRLAEHDNIFAYDLAWEPYFGPHLWRTGLDRQWEQWIVERYGSIENAEEDWDFAVPRDEAGQVTNPSQPQIDNDGPWFRMVAAYRRFLDTVLYKNYSEARRLVRTLDPHHAVSFRMTCAGDPTYKSDGSITYDFACLGGAVDIFEPEAYGRIGDWQRVRPGCFTATYGRWANPQLPVMWAEAGVQTWDDFNKVNSPHLLDWQASYYRDVYRMLIESGADGVFFWWYPGGYRVNERSDYGIINPDGTDRPVTQVIRELGPKLLAAPLPPRIDAWLTFDRDKHPDGLTGVYAELEDQYWTLLEQGRWPGLRTAGSGTTSLDCPMIAVGNTPCDGHNPPKYLDGAFDRVTILTGDDNPMDIKPGQTIACDADRPPTIAVTLTNLNEAEWIAPEQAGDQPGGVYLIMETPDSRREYPIPHSVKRFESVTLEKPAPPSGSAGPLLMYLQARQRSPFGERFVVEIKH